MDEGCVQLGDPRRTRRAVAIAEALAREPGASLPKQLHDPAALEATYRFLHTPDVTYEQLIGPPVAQTREEASKQQQVLLIQDTTEVDYQQHPTTTGLGPIGNGTHHGYLLQSVLAVVPESREVAGVDAARAVSAPACSSGRTKWQRAPRSHHKASATHPAPPDGIEPLAWLLLTWVPTPSVEHAWERVEWYRARWMVEDLHQGLKTGCQLEQRHLQEYAGLRTLLGLLAPVAVRLLQLGAAARQEPELPASQVLPADVVEVVASLDQRDAQMMTSQQCWYAIARYGG